MTSAQIAQINGTFQSQSMQQMQYSGMVGPRPYSGESMAGSMANFGAAAAAPVAGLGLALAGLDPFSMAIKGGMSGYASGGVGGAMMGGMAMAAIPMAGMAAAGWGASQVYEGMQQQQALNSALRSSFKMRNQFGGSGFSSSAMGQIGQDMRSMQDQLGPGGERAGFEELTRLASNMGRMGMADGVRNAKDFSDKFKTMVSTLKTIATEMGTSLEEAQKMMYGMKSSGVFKQSEAARFSGSIRQGTSATGYAATEFTSMMGIGSQISRSIGGLGRAGAQGGMEALTNIGVAQRAGILSEASIYNATGLTGAEGRQALATQEMQTSARFLKSGIGRRFMASMAGKDGSLDMADADSMMSGGVSTSETMKRARENLSGIGRANYIRNEGRIRGEVLAKFGALAPALAMRSWLGERGIDVDPSNDRAMLFTQRRLGIGRDEADVLLQQAKNLPKIMEERRVSEMNENLGQKVDLRSRQVGIEGLKKKFDHALDSVTDSMKAWGQKKFQNIQEIAERYAAEWTDSHVAMFRDDTASAYNVARRGGSAGIRARAETFGMNKDGSFLPRRSGGFMNGLMVGTEADKMKEFQRADADMFKSYGLYGAKSMADVDTQERIARGMSDAASNAKAMSGVSQEKAANLFNNIGRGRGVDLVENFRKYIDTHGDGSFAKSFRGAKSREERSGLIGSLMLTAGYSKEEVSERFALGERKGVYNISGASTVGALHQGVGAELLRNTSYGLQGEASSQLQTAIGEQALSREGRELRASLLGQDAGARSTARASLMREMSTLKAGIAKGGEDGVAAQARMAVAKSGLAASTMASLESAPDWQGLKEDERNKRIDAAMGGLSSVAEDRKAANASRAGNKLLKGITDAEMREKFVASANSYNQLQNAEQQIARLQEGSRLQTQAQKRTEALSRAGLLKTVDGKMTLSSQFEEKMLKGVGKENVDAARQFLLGAVSSQKGIANAADANAAISASFALGNADDVQFSGLNEKTREALMTLTRNTDGLGFIAEERGYEQYVSSTMSGSRKRFGKTGNARALSSMMGINFTDKEKRSMAGMDSGSQATFMEQQMGLTGDKHVEGLREALKGDTKQALSVLESREVKEHITKGQEQRADPIVLRGVKAQEAALELLRDIRDQKKESSAGQIIPKPEDKNQSG